MSEEVLLFEINRPDLTSPRVTLEAKHRFTVMSIREAVLLATELMAIVADERQHGAVSGIKPVRAPRW